MCARGNKIMKTEIKEKFITHAEWFRAAITEDVILCHTSALELLGMYNGFIDEKVIDVYALEKGRYENIVYHIVDSFDSIDTAIIFGVRCASFEYTINDMLGDLHNSDLWALTEALCNYYARHNDSFDGLNILPDNRNAFESIKMDAIEYYNGGD